MLRLCNPLAGTGAGEAEGWDRVGVAWAGRWWMVLLAALLQAALGLAGDFFL